jgi:glucuronosyltransferase
MPKYDKYVKEMFGHDTPYVGDIEKTMLLALVNSHPSIDYAESLPPSIIEVGGLQIKQAKALDDDINEFLMRGKKGSILMSFGTNFRSDEMGEERFKIFIETFRQLSDYNFLWKFETSEMLKDLPPNVMTKAWLPQNDILAHASITAFISHVGLLSTHEATYHGVPIVGIPLFVDQHRNLHKAITAGAAVKVDFMSLSVESFKSAIIEIASNPSYKRNMESRSKLFRDQKERPLERAIWWCEYVMRHVNVGHLRQVDFGFGLLSSHFWDIQVLILAGIVGIYMSLKRLCWRNSNKVTIHT